MDGPGSHGLPGWLGAKLRRIAAGGRPRVLDLFAGAGGISLGFHREGCIIAGAIESDPTAARTHALNFHSESPNLCELHGRSRDITALEPDELADELSLGTVDEAIDILVGGPPCQAYARVGRAKLREVADHPQAFRVDPRGNLYLRYLEYVRAFRPLALLVENVPDILHYAHHNVIEEIRETLDSLGYDAKYTLINSAFHGVPQMRDRVFLIGYRKELGARIEFPRATRHMKLPPGYAGTRAVALRYVDLLGGTGYVSPDLGDATLPFPVTAEQAIGDLPPIAGSSVRRGARRLDQKVVYRNDESVSVYAELMRQWPGFESRGYITDHAIRFLPRDINTFREMRPGAEYPEAHATAVRIVQRTAKREGLSEGSRQYRALYNSVVPPYDTGKFPNRWWKLRRDYPVRTLMAHIGKDTYSHIHYDSQQARTISVREAARLQSFPDGFLFCGTMNPAFRQVGNAVPPLLVGTIAEVICEQMVQASWRMLAMREQAA